MSQAHEDLETVTRSLSPERFARVRGIFEAALERPVLERRAYLEGACGTDQDLFLLVDGMLAAEANGSGFLDPGPVTASSSSVEEGRFPAGTILGERYRILGLLGRGGMGEVYRAFDLKLDQVVALKFLPEAANNNARLLERFRGEVRIARQVSHRNVCRVHDIGDADGLGFLSMEYIDGDNLGGLLQQIGRLPQDKALELARRLCAGLSAAHEKGVLHRDLKPANIMIDRRGQLLITDFGLAAAADAIPGADIRSGTPAYMSPEQKTGKEVTVRSDIYSLGLVLAEMFTGQRDTKTSTTKDLDPVIERVIERCLDPDPSKRPDSAITVARMLPGGDPLAEALAAGDTPSPAMVAASDDTGTLSVRWTVICMMFVVLGLPAALYLGGRSAIMGRTPFPYPQGVLAEKARTLATRLGYTKPVLEESYDFSQGRVRVWAVRNLTSEDYRAQLAEARPGEAFFLLEQRFSNVLTPGLAGYAYLDSLQISLDPRGRLFGLLTVPADGDPGPGGEPDWNALFEAAELDPAEWSPTEPQLIPPVRFNQRMAWTGRYPHIPQGPVRYEAAAWNGRVVSFQRTGPWSAETDAPQVAPSLVRIVLVTVFLVSLVVPAWYNFRTGRSDLAGAARLSVFILLCGLVQRLLATTGALIPLANLQLFGPLQGALLDAAVTGAAYLGLEPYVRKQWPQLLISWTRVLRGDVRNPLVGAHVLVGTTLGLGLGTLLAIFGIVAIRPNTPSLYVAQMAALRIAGFTSNLVGDLSSAASSPIVLVLLFVLLRMIVRRTWLAALLTIAVEATLTSYGSPNPPLIAATGVAQTSMLLLILARFGVFPLMVSYFVIALINRYPLTTDMSAWYAVFGLLPMLIILTIALWSFRTALGRRRVWNVGPTL